ncbi:hypothetical protein [Amycolatopsis thermophila]|uniref:Uncharacterized protein n=1 Tax=Amycolatopsis thermophila TaxID=206084 RepID=A0ABU0ENJ1_9PSEU|nr:hypothetical protein [Amycolatopsis thermophila]MDQ0376566.1 hypothetical protein [Amycolatopsis thermophila]
MTTHAEPVVREPPERIEDGLDVSYRDVPYPVVPAFTARSILHLAVECQAVLWNRNSSTRVEVRTKCGKSGVPADRRNFAWSRTCRRCYPNGAHL